MKDRKFKDLNIGDNVLIFDYDCTTFFLKTLKNVYYSSAKSSYMTLVLEDYSLGRRDFTHIPLNWQAVDCGSYILASSPIPVIDFLIEEDSKKYKNTIINLLNLLE